MAGRDALGEGAAVVAAGYLKRWMEGAVYDRLAGTEVIRSLQQSRASVRYGAEAGLNLLNAFFNHHFLADSAFKRLIKDIGLDAAPEIAKRIINGQHHGDDAHVAAALLNLSPTELVALMDWLYSVDDTERRSLVGKIAGLTADQMATFMALPAAEQTRFLSLTQAPAPRPPRNDLARGLRLFRERLKGGDDER